MLSTYVTSHWYGRVPDEEPRIRVPLHDCRIGSHPSSEGQATPSMISPLLLIEPEASSLQDDVPGDRSAVVSISCAKQRARAAFRPRERSTTCYAQFPCGCPQGTYVRRPSQPHTALNVFFRRSEPAFAETYPCRRYHPINCVSDRLEGTRERGHSSRHTQPEATAYASTAASTLVPIPRLRWEERRNSS